MMPNYVVNEWEISQLCVLCCSMLWLESAVAVVNSAVAVILQLYTST